MDAQIVITTGGILAFLGVLAKIVWDNLNSKINSNSGDIKEIRETFATKQELKNVKEDFIDDVDKIQKSIENIGDKFDRKMDKMMELLLKQGGGGNEK